MVIYIPCTVFSGSSGIQGLQTTAQGPNPASREINLAIPIHLYIVDGTFLIQWQGNVVATEILGTTK